MSYARTQMELIACICAGTLWCQPDNWVLTYSLLWHVKFIIWKLAEASPVTQPAPSTGSSPS